MDAIDTIVSRMQSSMLKGQFVMYAKIVAAALRANEVSYEDALTVAWLPDSEIQDILSVVFDSDRQWRWFFDDPTAGADQHAYMGHAGLSAVVQAFGDTLNFNLAFKRLIDALLQPALDEYGLKAIVMIRTGVPPKIVFEKTTV
jgi:hypothetical protein